MKNRRESLGPRDREPALGLDTKNASLHGKLRNHVAPTLHLLSVKYYVEKIKRKLEIEEIIFNPHIQQRISIWIR